MARKNVRVITENSILVKVSAIASTVKRYAHLSPRGRKRHIPGEIFCLALGLRLAFTLTHLLIYKVCIVARPYAVYSVFIAVPPT